jgi:hypothetical protein
MNWVGLNLPQHAFMTTPTTTKIFFVLALAGLLWGCAGKIQPYVNPDGVPTVTITFQNLAHLSDSARNRHLDVAVFKDDFQCRGRSEVVTRNFEVTIQAELRSYYTIFYKAVTFVENDPATYTDRCSGMYTFPLTPDHEYRVQFDEKERRCYFRVMKRPVVAGSEWKGVDELFPRRIAFPSRSLDGSWVDGPWCEEDGRWQGL